MSLKARVPDPDVLMSLAVEEVASQLFQVIGPQINRGWPGDARKHAAWLEGATEADIHGIKNAMEKRPGARPSLLDSRTAISSVNPASNRVTQIVIRPLKSPEFGSSLAVGKDLSDSSLRNDSNIKWRRGWDSNPRAGITRPSDFESAPL
jgi:hypothetical protein